MGYERRRNGGINFGHLELAAQRALTYSTAQGRFCIWPPPLIKGRR